jgi:hypothetical protein
VLGPAGVSAEAYFPLRILLSPEQRESGGGRHMVIFVEKETINARVNPVGLSSVTGGGIIPALIDQTVEGSRKQKAEGPLAEVRAALADYDLKISAVAAAEDIKKNIEWLDVNRIVATDIDPLTPDDVSAITDAEVLTIQYRLEIEPRFDSIKLWAHVELVEKELLKQISLKKIKKKKTTPGLKFSQDFICFVPLRGEKGDINQNAAKWISDGGKPIADSIDLAFAGVAKMLATALTTVEDDAKIVKRRKAKRVGYSAKAVENYYGKLVSEDETGTLIETQFGEWVYYYWPTQT